MEHRATVEEFREEVFTLLRENLVGFTKKAEGNGLTFTLVNGQSFQITLSKIEG